MPPQHILIICYTFPPFQGIGGRRWAKISKYLARHGHTVHVIHSDGSNKEKGSNWTMDVDHLRILNYPLKKKYPRVLSKRPLTSILDKVAYRYWSLVLPNRTVGNYYDKTIFWRNALLNKSKSLIHKYGIKNVIVTGAPFRLLYFATDLRSLGVNLIGDFRDPWTWSDAYGHKSLNEKQMAHEVMMERTVVEIFNHIVSPHKAILDHLKKTYPNVNNTKFHHISHGLDKDDIGITNSAIRSNGQLRLIYAGSLYGAKDAEQYFKALLSSLSSIRKNNPRISSHFIFDLYITGNSTSRYQKMVLEQGFEDQIFFHSPIPAKDIFKELLASDYVLLYMPKAKKDFLVTKLCEIFSLGVPVLHVGPEGYISRFIEEHNTGYSFRLNELQEKLNWVINERPEPLPDRQKIEALFNIELITDRLEKEVLVS